ncbi:MAG: thermonuclease family protein [Rhodospirillales bacterium]
MLAQHFYWFPLAILVVLVPAPATATNAITGKARIIDGDTIEIAGERIRLHGIDAPESKQKCTAEGKGWACGQKSTFALAQFIETHWVTCKGDMRDRYGWLIAVCYAGGKDINAAVVRQGWRWLIGGTAWTTLTRKPLRGMLVLGCGAASSCRRGNGDAQSDDL